MNSPAASTGRLLGGGLHICCQLAHLEAGQVATAQVVL